eukprot:gene4533-7910_t
MNLNLVTEVICKNGEEVFSIVKNSPKSYTWNNIEFTIDSITRNCYGTGSIYKNKTLEKIFRVIQFVSNGQRSRKWDFNLKELIKIEKEKMEKFMKYMEEKFSDSETEHDPLIMISKSVFMFDKMMELIILSECNTTIGTFGSQLFVLAESRTPVIFSPSCQVTKKEPSEQETKTEPKLLKNLYCINGHQVGKELKDEQPLCTFDKKSTSVQIDDKTILKMNKFLRTIESKEFFRKKSSVIKKIEKLGTNLNRRQFTTNIIQSEITFTKKDDELEEDFLQKFQTMKVESKVKIEEKKPKAPKKFVGNEFSFNKFIQKMKNEKDDLSTKLSKSYVFQALLDYKYFLPFSLCQSVVDLLTSDAFTMSVVEYRTNEVISSFIHSQFINISIQKYIIQGLSKNTAPNIIKLYEFCLKKISHFGFMIQLSNLEKRIQSFNNFDLNESMNKLKDLKEHCLIEEQSIKENKKTVNLDGENIKQISIYPTMENLTQKNKNLVANNILRSWNSLNDYVSTHFNLLKEDYVSTLREGMEKYSKNEKIKTRDLPVFTNAEIVKISAEKSVPLFSLKFQSNIKADRLEKSRVFTYGSLVLLFPQIDDKKKIFKCEPIIGIVQDRDAIGKMTIDIDIIGNIELVDLLKTYIIIECPCYFNSIGPVLTTLKSFEALPFQELLLGQKTEIDIPNYIKENPIVDITCLMKSQNKKVKIDVVKEWIDENNSNLILDKSQSNALKNTLNSRISIIKGPPGTGKTFIGIKIAKLLVKKINAPIVIICYTNHALDQFLEGLIDEVPKLVRIGGRSKTENQKLISRNLNKISGRFETEWELRKNLRNLKTRLESSWTLLEKLKNDVALFRCMPKFLSSINVLKQDNLVFNLNDHDAVFTWLNGKEKEKKKTLLEATKKKKGKGLKNRIGNAFDALQEELVDKTEIIEEEDIELPMKDEVFEEFDLKGFIKIQPKTKMVQQNEETESDEEDYPEDLEYLDQIMKEEVDDLLKERKAIEDDFIIDELDDDEEEKITEIDMIPKYFQDFEKEFCKSPYKMKPNFRKKVIQQLRQNIFDHLKGEISTIITEMKELNCKKQQTHDQQTFEILRDCPIIGLTSSRAAVSRQLFQYLKAPVYIFEEAAELLECQMVACLHDSIQHMIMIGDEQQLRPKVNSYNLEKNYNFSISLFERLVKRNFSISTLLTQKRMRPEISAIMKNFYEGLEDHPCVMKFPNIEGMVKNLQFITHDHKETESPHLGSKSNDYEAEYICNLGAYLSNQLNYTENDITIVTPYKGQQLLIKTKLASKKMTIRTVTIDDFQGEENKIILLSLVRSNEENVTGFVSIKNRIIVSLSRAQYGLYVIGNSALFRQNDDWYQVLQYFQENDLLSKTLELQCPNHPETITKIKTAKDLLAVNLGGCSSSCNYQLDCGHTCGRLCHAKDPEHATIKCQKKCSKDLDCGHECQVKCHLGKTCPQCQKIVKFQFTDCKHSINVKCSSNVNNLECKSQCKKRLKCSHLCTQECFKCKENGECGACTAKLTAHCKICDKDFKYTCGTKPICTNPCIKKLGCGHLCPGNCGSCTEDHQPCDKKCERTLLCSHKCTNHDCSSNCPECERPCLVKCSHVECRLKCNELCIQCIEPCQLKCEHSKCTKKCSQICDRNPCEKRCSKKLKCDHRCQGLCGETCPPCMVCDATNDESNQWEDSVMFCKSSELEENDLVYTLECKHTFLVSTLDQHMKVPISAEIQYKRCPNCNKAITFAPRYQKALKTIQNDINQVKIDIKKKFLSSDQEKKEILKAVNQNHVSGHWYKCPNGHLYFIGECGGAMEESKCPDCGEKIGGTRHQLLGSNERSLETDEFLGVEKKTWL